MSLDLSKLSSFLKKDSGKSDGSAVVGVDVGLSSIKIVQLHGSKSNPVLDTYGELQLGPYGDVEIGRGVRLRVDKLIEAFVDILREAQATSKKVSVALSYGSSFTTIVTVPAEEPDKIAAIIPVEAKKYVPVPLSDVTLDWFPVSAHAEKHATKLLLAAIHNEALERYEKMVQGASVTQVAAEIEIFSAIRTTVTGDDTTVAIIDCGASATKLYIVHKGIIGKSHSVPMNGVDLTNAIAKTLGVDFRTAEEEKRRRGLGIVEGNPELEKAIVTVLERGMKELLTVVKRFEEEEHMTVDRVVLTGSGALLAGLLPYTKDMLGKPTTLANPFGAVSYPAFLEDVLKEAGPSFAVAIGAALRALHR